MASKDTQTWLEVLDGRLNIDVDWMDPAFIRSMPVKPHDQTSNQLWQGIQLSHASNATLLAKTAKELGRNGWLAVYTKMGTLMCKENLDSIQGRLLVQTSPSQAYNTEGIVAHAMLYDQEFKQRGISRDRFCIKILSTGPGVIAMKRLVQEGISVLGTAVFNLEQAVACSQAGCLSISPYYNHVASFQDVTLWPNVDDPATQHPFSHRLYQMVDAYRRLFEKTGKEQPLIKLAAYLTFASSYFERELRTDEIHRLKTLKEINAAAELGCHSVTLSPQLLEELANAKYDSSLDSGSQNAKLQPDGFYAQLPTASTRLQPLLWTDPLRKSTDPFEQVKIEVDYLANNAAALVKALDSDPEGKQRLEDAIAMFVQAEKASEKLIESLISPHLL